MTGKPWPSADRELFAQAADYVSQNFRREVTAFFKKLLTYYYETTSQLDQSPLWGELPELFRKHCDVYTHLAMGNRSLKRIERLKWVKRKIEDDRNTILIKHFGCDANGYLRPVSDRAALGQGSWCVAGHYGFLNFNAVCDVFRRKLAIAMSDALKAATITILSHTGDSKFAAIRMIGVPAFHPLEEDYRSIHWDGKQYRLTSNQAGIIRVLDDARTRGVHDVSGYEIRKKVGCRRIHDSFRSGDGPKLWQWLVVSVPGSKGIYRLNLPDLK